jgi:hypothetical protein
LSDETGLGGRDDRSHRGGAPTRQDPPAAFTPADPLVVALAWALATAPIARPAAFAVTASAENTRVDGVVRAANLTLD